MDARRPPCEPVIPRMRERGERTGGRLVHEMEARAESRVMNGPGEARGWT